MTSGADWRTRVGDAWAAEWRRTDRSFVALDPTLLTAALSALGEGARVLDIGCGAGATSLAIAAARPDVEVTGVDLSAALVDAARSRAEGRADFRVADAAALSDDVRYDRLVSRHGVMFFDDPVAAFLALRRVTMPGGRIVFSCFRERALNGWATEPAAALGIEAGAADGQAGGPGPFAFARRDEVERLLTAAGWGDVRAGPVDYEYVAGDGPDAVGEAVALLRRIGPVARTIADSPHGAKRDLIERLAALCAARRFEGRVVFPAAAWIWTARNSEEPQ
ncbi:SAM-dependent methyltransferase [Sphingomonas spermidinifaciens]|uniref:SAM-dependent methyltransferase n=1 Tax=Sphingomonas spermidinifaciens TaxID=1141889 RepID=A0A2A4B3L5_9SPHN|nr:class I SAM-dependent methyltransferase [Sphingomonas spermidinifaciens]PCD02637.1 SAM-dependent methyltransferase [Sphingomonas spermidinifaciens]